MSSHVLLSEIHPDAQRARSFNALLQAQQWHNMLPELDWKHTDFITAIKGIEQATRLRGQQLIIRDWSHVDYLGPPVTNTPAKAPALLNALTPHFDVRSIQLVRHPLDTWLSLRRLNLIKKHNIDVLQFLSAYRCYLTSTAATHQLVYEEFLQAPDTQLKASCDSVGLHFDPQYHERWFNYDKITGDTSNGGSLRKEPSIGLRPRRQCLDIDQSWLEDQDDYRFIIEKLYPNT